MSKLVDIYKRQVTDRPVLFHLRGTKQQLGLCWSSEADSEPRLPL